MRAGTFKFCMLFAAFTLFAVALFYFFSYIAMTIALSNSGLKPFYQQSVKALWLTFGCQALLIGALYAAVSWRPHAVTREVIVLLGLVQLIESLLLLLFAGSPIAAILLGVAAICVLIGAIIWPRRITPDIRFATPAESPAPTPSPSQQS